MNSLIRHSVEIHFKAYFKKLSFLHRNLKRWPEKLRQTAYFSLIRYFMEYGATVWDPYQNSDKFERVQHYAARSSKVGIPYTLVLLMSWGGFPILKGN